MASTVRITDKETGKVYTRPDNVRFDGIFPKDLPSDKFVVEVVPEATVAPMSLSTQKATGIPQPVPPIVNVDQIIQKGALGSPATPKAEEALPKPSVAPLAGGQSLVGEGMPTAEAPAKKELPKLTAPTLPEYKAPTPTSIEDVQRNLANIRKQAGVVDPDGKLETASKSLDEQMSTARAMYETAMANARTDQEKETVNTQWKEVAGLLGQALVNIGAGIVGLKTGRDLSGVKFNPIDWSKEYDRIQTSAQNKIKDAFTTLNLKVEDIQTKKKEIQDKLEVERGEKKEIVREQQGAYLSGVEAADRAKSEKAKMDYQRGVQQAELGFEAQKANVANQIQVMRDEEKAQAQRELQELKNSLTAAKSQGKITDQQAKMMEKRLTSLNKAKSLLVAANALDKDTGAYATAKQEFVFELKQATGASDSDADSLWERGSDDDFFFNKRQEAMAELEALGVTIGQPAAQGGKIEGQETKVVGGKTYKKVNGAWVPQ